MMELLNSKFIMGKHNDSGYFVIIRVIWAVTVFQTAGCTGGRRMGRRRMRRNGIRRPVRMAVVCLLGFSLAGAAGCGRKAAPAPENARGAAGGGPDLLAMPQYPCMPDRETDWEAWRS